MQAVEDPVDDRSQENPAPDDEDQTAKKCVKGGEELSGRTGEVGAINRPLPAHQHGGFQQGIQPGEATDPPIAQDADGQGEADED